MRYALISAFVLATFVTRVAPFFHWGEAPLGYDTGFYVANAVAYGAGGLGYGGPFYWLWWLPLRLGASPEAVVHTTILLTQVALALAFYGLGVALGKTFGSAALRGRPWVAGAVAIGLFAVSTVQFLGYWWMFIRQGVAMVFLVLALRALILRQRRWAMLWGGIGGGVHPATFLPFGSALAVTAVIEAVRACAARDGVARRIRWAFVWWTCTVGLGMLAVAAFLNTPEFHGYGSWFVRNRGLIPSDAPTWELPMLRGLFIDFPTFLIAVTVYLPFVITQGVRTVVQLRHNWSFSALFTVVFAIVAIVVSGNDSLLFNRRFLLVLDISFIVLATTLVAQFFLWLAESPWGRRSIAGLAIGLWLNVFWFSWSAEPQVTPQELREIKELRTVVGKEPNAFAMATDARYTPWVYGYSRLPTIAPGYLQWNRWSLEEWEDFWSWRGGGDRRRELLARYSAPVYIVIGDRGPRVDQHLRSDPAFMQVSAHVWRYDPFATAGSQ